MALSSSKQSGGGEMVAIGSDKPAGTKTRSRGRRSGAGNSDGLAAVASPAVSRARMKQGAIKHAHAERGHDLYETPAAATLALLRSGEPLPRAIWEPCAGRGAIARVLREAGHTVVATDLVRYSGADPYVMPGVDFLKADQAPRGCSCIVTNPPYRLADDIVRQGLKLADKVIVLLRLMALEGAGRSDLIDEKLRRVWVGKERLPMMHREGWSGPKLQTGAMPFAWFVFEQSGLRRPVELSRISWRQNPP